MSFSIETQEKIKQFAKEQSRYYLNEAEMTYIEKFRNKTGQAKRTVGKTLARFKSNSEQAIEAQNDMLLYMSDYMNDLMSQGMTESEAFEKASEELKAVGESDIHADFHQRLQQYYENISPADMEVIGLFYGGFMFIGVSIGSLIGYMLGGGRQGFLNGGWKDSLAGTIAGAVLGIGIGEICHAVITLTRKR